MEPVPGECYEQRGGVAPFGGPTAHSARAASGVSSKTGRGALSEAQGEEWRLPSGPVNRVKGYRTLGTELAAIAGAVLASERNTAPYDASVAGNPILLDGREASGGRGTHEDRNESQSVRAASGRGAASGGRSGVLGGGRGPYKDVSRVRRSV